MKPKEFTFPATRNTPPVSALVLRPPKATHVYVFAHGAGAPMSHPFMKKMAERLYDRGLATFRFNFPYMEARKRAPNPPPVLKKSIRSAVARAEKDLRGLTVLAGGKSMGGRMTSQAMAEDAIPGVKGLIFLGFPLHPARKPDRQRADHLFDVKVPMLFVQGDRDDLADLNLFIPVTADLGRRATVHVIEGGDHSFHVLKSSGRHDEDVLDEAADAVAAWAARR